MAERPPDELARLESVSWSHLLTSREDDVQATDNRRRFFYKLAQQGLDPAEIERRLVESAESGNTLLVPDDLMHLKRGGRLTPLAATLGSMLKIKPILQLNKGTEGKVDVLDKVRTISPFYDT